MSDQAASLNQGMSMRKRIVVQGEMLASLSRGPESIPWSAMLRSPMRGCFCSLGIKFKRVVSKKDTGSQNIRGKKTCKRSDSFLNPFASKFPGEIRWYYNNCSVFLRIVGERS